jgi:hypothetical protein
MADSRGDDLERPHVLLRRKPFLSPWRRRGEQTPTFRRSDPLVSQRLLALPEYECVEMPDGKQPQRFYLAHIEFDDMGELWSIGDLRPEPTAKPSQLANALDVIRKAQSEADQKHLPLVVITFVHGWHNNASARDEEKKNLGSFKTVLQALSSRPSLEVANKPPVLVGIFLSWRGQSIAGDVAVTYWGRRVAATKVGGPSMTEVATRLMFETKGVPLTPSVDDRCEAHERKQHSHFAIIAHSFFTMPVIIPLTMFTELALRIASLDVVVSEIKRYG